MELAGAIARYVRTQCSNTRYSHRIPAMRGRTLLLIATLGVTIGPVETAHAQLSPQGVLGGITRPFRSMLGNFGHFPRGRHHHRAATEARAAAPGPNETSTTNGSRLGWVGPPAWSNAYEDVVGFTFWPDDYASRLRARGFDVIADTITGRFDLPRSLARTATTGSAVKSDANNDSSTDQCDSASATDSNWPAARVQQILQLSDDQRAALDKLQVAVGQSVKNIRTNCSALSGLAPPDRLRALIQTLWSVRDAGISIREPVKVFYDALTTTQKNGFVSQQAQPAARPDTKSANTAMNKQYQACASQNVEKAERLIKEIEMRVRPTKEQAASLENFHKASTDMAKLLIASCAQPIAGDPMARLDSADDQLTAVNYAATTVQIAFDGFYLKLNGDQKARFNSLAR
jgi:hypothetical protein